MEVGWEGQCVLMFLLVLPLSIKIPFPLFFPFPIYGTVTIYASQYTPVKSLWKSIPGNWYFKIEILMLREEGILKV